MEKDKVKVKLNIGGVDVEIEAAPELLSQAIDQVVRSLNSVIHLKGEESKKKFFASSCKEAIEMLWRDGWFSTERRLSEVWEELSRRGYNFDRSAIAHALHDLVREGVLTRMGKARRYRYIQKVPYLVSKSG